MKICQKTSWRITILTTSVLILLFSLYYLLAREILGITGMTIKETGEAGKGARFEITVPEEAYRFTGKQ